MAQLMRQRRKQGRYKHDGYRTVPVVERGSARAYTRNGHDCSHRAAQEIKSRLQQPETASRNFSVHRVPYLTLPNK